MIYIRRLHPMIVGAGAGAGVTLVTGLGPDQWIWWVPFLVIGIWYSFFTKREDFSDADQSEHNDSK